MMLFIIVQTRTFRTSPFVEYPESFRSAVHASAIAADPTLSRRVEGRKEVTKQVGNLRCYLEYNFPHSLHSVRVPPRNGGLESCPEAYNSVIHFRSDRVSPWLAWYYVDEVALEGCAPL